MKLVGYELNEDYQIPEAVMKLLLLRYSAHKQCFLHLHKWYDFEPWRTSIRPAKRVWEDEPHHGDGFCLKCGLVRETCGTFANRSYLEAYISEQCIKNSYRVREEKRKQEEKEAWLTYKKAKKEAKEQK